MRKTKGEKTAISADKHSETHFASVAVYFASICLNEMDICLHSHKEMLQDTFVHVLSQVPCL